MSSYVIDVPTATSKETQLQSEILQVDALQRQGLTALRTRNTGVSLLDVKRSTYTPIDSLPSSGQFAWCESSGRRPLLVVNAPVVDDRNDSSAWRLLRLDVGSSPRTLGFLWPKDPAGAVDPEQFDVHPKCKFVAVVNATRLAVFNELGQEVDADVERRRIRLKGNCVRWSPDESQMAVCDGTMIRIWRVADDRLNELPLPMAHRETVRDVAWNPEGTRLATVGEDGVLKIWVLSRDETPTEIVAGQPLLSVAWSPKGDRLVTGGVYTGRTLSYSRLQVWDERGPGIRSIEVSPGVHASFSADDIEVTSDRQIIGLDSIKDQDGNRIEDSTIVAFARRRAGRKLIDSECRDLLGWSGCTCPILASCRMPN